MPTVIIHCWRIYDQSADHLLPMWNCRRETRCLIVITPRRFSADGFLKGVKGLERSGSMTLNTTAMNPDL